jgi:hypothetical protein
MSIGRTPQNQLNALPLITPEAVGQAGDVVVVGGVVVRTWTPAATGISGTLGNIADPRTNTLAYLLTNWLDMSGCSRFTAMLAGQVNAIGGDVAQTWSVFAIPYVDAGGTIIEPVPFPPGPDLRNLTGNYASNAYPQVGTLKIPALTFGGPPFPQYKSAQCSWSAGGASTGFSIEAGSIGTHRLLLTAPNGADPIQYYLKLWGQS